MQESPLIGVSDGPIEKKRATFYYTNKIGGDPDLIPGISAAHHLCALCDGILVHVVQVYCPLAASPYHRTINVFACSDPQCWGKTQSWKVLRAQCLESELQRPLENRGTNRAAAKHSAMSTTDWCGQADDWGMEGDDPEPERPKPHGDTAQPATDSLMPGTDVSSRLQGLCLSGPGDSGGAARPAPVPTFQPFYVSVMEESDLVGHHDLEHANQLLREYEEREGVAVGAMGSRDGEGGEEKYEKAEAKHGDAVFSNFRKRISLCPEQVLRYSWSGSPLFLAAPPSNINQKVPPCAHCGSARVFEFQLMPALVSLLHSTDLKSGFALEFGTVLVYTCRDSCWTSGSDNPVEEFLFVQADPDQKLFK